MALLQPHFNLSLHISVKALNKLFILEIKFVLVLVSELKDLTCVVGSVVFQHCNVLK